MYYILVIQLAKSCMFSLCSMVDLILILTSTYTFLFLCHLMKHQACVRVGVSNTRSNVIS
uniref:Uncharacterized protein n=1 Tax=Anguilla anguilla TaxID=7936 RepID=A0A0E9PX47_ANGAN